jgi:hypothetical protein
MTINNALDVARRNGYAFLWNNGDESPYTGYVVVDYASYVEFPAEDVSADNVLAAVDGWSGDGLYFALSYDRLYRGFIYVYPVVQAPTFKDVCRFALEPELTFLRVENDQKVCTLTT